MKKPKPLTIQKLKKLCEEEWKKACHRRDKSTCQICGATKDKGAVIQVDHCFTRKAKQLFYDTRNGTILCKSCHTKKTYHVQGFEKIVDDFVRRREGIDWWVSAMHQARYGGAVKFTYQELEDLISDLRNKFTP